MIFLLPLLYALFLLTLFIASNTSNSAILGPREAKHYKDILISFYVIDFAYTTTVLLQALKESLILLILLFVNIVYISYFTYHYLKNPLNSKSPHYKLIFYHFFMIGVLFYCSLLLNSPLINLYLILVIVFTIVRFRYLNSRIGVYKE